MSRDKRPSKTSVPLPQALQQDAQQPVQTRAQHLPTTAMSQPLQDAKAPKGFHGVSWFDAEQTSGDQDVSVQARRGRAYGARADEMAASAAAQPHHNRAWQRFKGWLKQMRNAFLKG